MSTQSAQRPLLMALLVLCILVAAAALQGNDQTPAPPEGNPTCAVCAGAITDQTNLAQARLADGTTLFFEGPAHLFRFLAAPGSYLRDRGPIEIQRAFVTTFYGRKTIPVEQAWFVIGSDVPGNEMVAHESIEKANQFILEHGGTRLVQSKDVTPSILAQLP